MLSAGDELEHLRMAADVARVAPPEFVLPAHRSVPGAGVELHCVDWGTVGKPDLLFLHGAGLTARTWDLVCLTLCRESRCLALDLRGHGDSDWPADGNYDIDALVDDIEAAADALQLSRFGMVGMSLGGITAFGYAARHPDRLRGLVLVDSGPRRTQQDTGGYGRRRVQEFMAGPSALPSVDAFVERAAEFNHRRDRRLLRRSLLHNLRQLPDGSWTWKYDRDGLMRRRRDGVGMRQRELWDHASRIRCPTLVVRGGESDVFSDEDAAELAAALPRAEWARVEGAGHTVQGDNPRGLLDLLGAFLGGLEA